MADDLVKRAHWGDLTGQNWAVLARLSHEPDYEPSESHEDAGGTTARPKFIPQTGYDIKNRDEQVKDARTFVESRGGRIVYVYEEPDTSAWKRRRVQLPDGRLVYRVIRPVFEGALDDLKHGQAPNSQRLDGLIVSDIDRLTRDNRHLEDAIEVVENFRRPIIDITGTLDLLTDNGRTVARIVVATKNQQSADTARRVSRKHKALQQAGIPTGGRRPFGWQDDKRTRHAVESEHLRDAVRRIIDGAQVHSIVADWNSRGITTPSGRTWKFDTIKVVLRNPRICGYRSRITSDFDPQTGTENKRSEIVFNDEGEPVIGKWQPIISVEEWEALIDIIGAAPTPTATANARTYLLTGILRCGKDDCDAPLRALKQPPHRKYPDGFWYYACSSKGTGRGCGGVKINGPETDELVRKMVIAKHEREAARRQSNTSVDEWVGEAELARIREDIADLKWARRERKISKERYFADLAEAEANERTRLKERNTWLRRKYASEGKPVDLRAKWPTITLSERRGYIEQALTAVLVLPAPYRGAPLRDRVDPLWRPDQDSER
ncbi:recombinase family protein [Streptomycetaceae bacterium NBC_01309]